MIEEELQDEEFIAGETKLITLIFIKKDTGTPIDLSTFIPTLKVCYSEDKSYILLAKNGMVVPNETGMVEFILDADNTEGWEEGSYIFHIELVSTSGKVIKVEGEWLVGSGM